MKTIPAAVVALCLASFPVNANAEYGRNGAALLGGAAGVAIGAAGATMMMNPRRRPILVEEEVTPVYEPACSMRLMDLFDRDGNFVKKDRVRICR